MEDLTWALHQVEQAIEHPELAFEHYRVPATPIPEPTGLFNPPSEKGERQQPQPDPSIRRRWLDDALWSRLLAALGEAEVDIPVPYEET